MTTHALEPPERAFWPYVGYVPGGLLALLGLGDLLSGSLAGIFFAALGGSLVYIGRRIAASRAGCIGVDGFEVTILVKGVFSSTVVLYAHEIAEVIFDPEGARVGGDRLRFPTSGSPGQRRFLDAKYVGGYLFDVSSYGGQPNVALVFDEPRRLPVRDPAHGRKSWPGIALALANPVSLRTAMAAIADTRAVDGSAAPAVPFTVHDVEVVGAAHRVLTRFETIAIASLLLAMLTSGAIGKVAAKGGLPVPMSLGALFACVLFLAGLLLLQRRWLRSRRPSP